MPRALPVWGCAMNGEGALPGQLIQTGQGDVPCWEHKLGGAGQGQLMAAWGRDGR